MMVNSGNVLNIFNTFIHQFPVDSSLFLDYSYPTYMVLLMHIFIPHVTWEIYYYLFPLIPSIHYLFFIYLLPLLIMLVTSFYIEHDRFMVYF